MQYGEIPGIPQRISRIVQGSMMFRVDDPDYTFGLLDAAVAAGINAFDLAYVYGGGKCEVAFGHWLAARGNRADVVVIDKGCHPAGPEKRVSPEDISADIATHLERLQTDYLDLWMFHRDDPQVPVGPLVERLNEHLVKGDIRAYGGSNWTVERIVEAQQYAVNHGLTPMVASSPNFSLAEQIDSPWGDDCVTISGPGQATAREWYARNRMPLLTWSSLARGFFSGRLSPENFAAVRDQFEEHTIRCYVCEDNWERLRRVRQLAMDKGLTIPQVALAWILHHPLNVFALVGSHSPAEIQANCIAVETHLTEEECRWLDLG